MRTLLIGSLVIFLGYMMTLPACQYRALRNGREAAARRDYETAQSWVFSLLQEKPNFFAEQARALCGQISIQQAEALLAGHDPDFAAAARVLRGQTERCQGYAHVDTQSVLEKVASRHLDYATTRCQQQKYDDALRHFQAIATLAYPEQVLQEASQETAWCRLTLAKNLAKHQWFAEAMEQVVRAMESGNGTIRTAALREVPLLVEQEVAYWLDQRQYIRAFAVLDERKQRFAEEPEAAWVFPRLEGQLEMQVFGVLLAQPCGARAARRSESNPVPAVAVSTRQGGVADTNLTVRNTIASPLRVLLRGPKDDELRLKPRGQKSLQLEPGQYLVGIYSPGRCEVKPKHTVWKIEPFVHHTIDVLLQN